MRILAAGFIVLAAVANFAQLARAKEPRTEVAGAGEAATATRAMSDPQSGGETSEAKPRKAESAVFAGGCFWCTELAFEQIKGVLDVECGYCGGSASTATYERVHRGTTAHAEVVKVTYDPARIRYDQLLDVFFDVHDPTQLNRQGEDDVGRQYRSAIFFAGEEQKKAAEAKIKELQDKRVFTRRIVTRLEPLATFYPAESYHQNFAERFAYLPYIQTHAIPRACNARINHPELIERGK